MSVITWPRDIIASRVEFYMEKNTTRNASPLSKTVQTLDRQGRRWVATFDFRIFVEELARKMDAMLDDGDTFLIWDMKREAPLNGVITGVAVNGAHVRGNRTIAIDGLPASQTHAKAGDYLNIGDKLYRLTSDIAANGAGAGTAQLNRGLLEDTADNATINFDRPTCEMLLVDDVQAARAADNSRLYTYSLAFIEAL